MTRLSDTQSILLSTAAGRPDGSLLPPPATIRATGAALERSLRALVRRGLAEKRPVRDLENGYRVDPGGYGKGVFVTAAGLDAIGVSVDPELDSGGDAPSEAASANEHARPRGKLGELLDAIEASSGATLAELTAATSWLPHTTRAAITRLRQRGFDIRLEERDQRKAYRIRGEA